ncbi:MAG: DUF1206 domain-containing protein, partial [Planctomycetes bacterium]|nr:DUF1206 domain-containing protein [Planctomycetota bacterium]
EWTATKIDFGGRFTRYIEIDNTDPDDIGVKPTIIVQWTSGGGFLKKKTYHTKINTVEGVKELFTHTLKADYPIGIDFTGSSAPSTKGTSGSSRLVRFAEGVRGVLFLIFAVSLVIAIVLPDIGQTLGMSEIIGKLIGHWIGKGVLVVIAAAFFIYGLKYLRAIK